MAPLIARGKLSEVPFATEWVKYILQPTAAVPHVSHPSKLNPKIQEIHSVSQATPTSVEQFDQGYNMYLANFLDAQRGLTAAKWLDDLFERAELVLIPDTQIVDPVHIEVDVA